VPQEMKNERTRLCSPVSRYFNFIIAITSPATNLLTKKRKEGGKIVL